MPVFSSNRTAVRLSVGWLLLVGLIVALVPQTAGAQYASPTRYTSDNADTDDFFGSSVARVGVKADTEIFVIGAPGDADDGRAYLLNGNGDVRATLTSRNGQNGGRFGATVGVVGDVTGDGFPDVVVGAPSEDAGGFSNAGYVYIFNGDTGNYVVTLQTPVGQTNSGRNFGRAVAGIGDITGDGIPDVAVGAPSEEASGASTAGKVYLMSGDTGDLISGTPIAGKPEGNGRFGASVAGVGDLVGDGTPDLLVGAPGESETVNNSTRNGAGRAYVINGNTYGKTVITSGNIETGGQFGSSVAAIGTGDDQDFAVGAVSENGGQSGAGRVYLYDGANLGQAPTAFTSANPEGQGKFGASVAGLGDVDGDGSPEVLVGAPNEAVNGTGDAGRAYIFSPSTPSSPFATLTSPTGEDGQFGTSVGGDGRPIVGVPREDDGSTLKAGRVYHFPPSIAFVDGNIGEPYSPKQKPQKDTDGNPVGRLKLSAGASGPSLKSVTVMNEATNSDGVERIELWSSTDSEFDAGTDTELAYSSSGVDNVTFSGLDQSIPVDALYFFVVVDLGPDAGGNYRPVIADEVDLVLGGGALATVNGQPTSSFSNNYLSTESSALPVELVRLNAKNTGRRTVTVSWRTVSETNNAGFEVQRRSQRTETWRMVSSVDGHGTTQQTHRYRVTDEDIPYAADSLSYRLKQVDTDGSVHYSSIVTVQKGAPDRPKLLSPYPNPVRSEMTVQYAVPDRRATPSVDIQLFDMLGREVRAVDRNNRTAGARYETTLDVRGLPSGMYILRLTVGKTSRSKRITVIQ